MAAKTPATVGAAGFVDPVEQMYVGPLTTAQSYLVNGTVKPKGRYSWRTVYFADIDDGDTWASLIPGIVACMWQGNGGITDAVQASADAAGVVTFETVSTADTKGWLHLIIDDPQGLYGKRLQ